MQNYTASYTNGASEGASEFSLWPHEVKADASNATETMDAYAEKKYFNNLWRLLFNSFLYLKASP